MNKFGQLRFPVQDSQSIPTNCPHSVLSSSSFIKRFFFKLNIDDISKVIVVIVRHSCKNGKLRKAPYILSKRLRKNIKKSKQRKVWLKHLFREWENQRVQKQFHIKEEIDLKNRISQRTEGAVPPCKKPRPPGCLYALPYRYLFFLYLVRYFLLQNTLFAERCF